MEWGLYTKIVDEAAGIPAFKQLCITGLGETLLDPLLIDRLEYARKVAPHLLTDLFTNGSFLTPARFEALKAAGLTRLNISLNAASAEDRKRVMRLDDWDKVIGHIHYALAHKGNLQIEIHAVVNDDTLSMERAKLLRESFGLLSDGGFFLAIQEGNWAGMNRTVEGRQGFDPNSACHRALNHYYVTWDGRVTTCCQDPFGGQVFGDLKVDSLKSIYNSERYTYFRSEHAADRAAQFEICKNCTRL